jgi:hypothetical protein
MGLGQVPKEEDTAGSAVMEVEGGQITWEKEIEEMNAFYGSLIIDYRNSLFGSDFVVGYGGMNC